MNDLDKDLSLYKMVNRKLLSMLSLCQKAGKMVSGEVSVEKNIQSGMALYVIVPKDASENTIEKFKNKTEYYEVDFCVFGEKDMLSQSIGKVNRTVFGITDDNFANKIKEYIKIIEEQEEQEKQEDN